MDAQRPPAQRSIVFYDGDCGLCNRAITMIWQRDPEGVFHFASLQSAFARDWIPDEIMLDTIYVWHAGQLQTRSSAICMILSALPGYQWLGSLLSLIPRPVRDYGYRLIATHRHRLLPPPTCSLVPPEIQQRFITD